MTGKDAVASAARCLRGLCLASSSRLWLFYQGRDIASPVEHAPHVDVVLPLDVEDYIREARQRPAAKSVYLQLGCVPGRADGGMLAGGCGSTLVCCPSPVRGGVAGVAGAAGWA